MRQAQNMIVPFLAGLGVGAAASRMMKGRGSNLKKVSQMIPAVGLTQEAVGTTNNQQPQ